MTPQNTSPSAEILEKVKGLQDGFNFYKSQNASSKAYESLNDSLSLLFPSIAALCLEQAEEIKRLRESQIPEINYDIAALTMDNEQLRDALNRQTLIVEALYKYKGEIRMKEWSNQSDMLKAEAILYDCLRSVLVPKKQPSLPSL